VAIVIRVAESDGDLESWRWVRTAVLPHERALPVADMRAMATHETLYVIAELDGELAGSGLGGRSSFDYAGVHPRVLPAARRRGVGTALLVSITVRGPLPLRRP
jgi:mycothiol synthase